MDGSLQNKCYIFAFSGRRWKARGARGPPDTRDSSFLTPFPSCLSRTPATPVLCLPSLAWKTQKYNACSVDWLTEALLNYLSLWTPARQARGTPRKMIPSTTVSFVQQKRITGLQRIQTTLYRKGDSTSRIPFNSVVMVFPMMWYKNISYQ